MHHLFVAGAKCGGGIVIVPSHQDSVFLYTDPPSAVGFWFALEDCTKTNGCLSFVPGSHKTSPITTRFVRLSEGGTGFVELGGELREPEEEEFKVEECPAGKTPLPLAFGFPP